MHFRFKINGRRFHAITSYVQKDEERQFPSHNRNVTILDEKNKIVTTKPVQYGEPEYEDEDAANARRTDVPARCDHAVENFIREQGHARSHTKIRISHPGTKEDAVKKAICLIHDPNASFHWSYDGNKLYFSTNLPGLDFHGEANWLTLRQARHLQRFHGLKTDSHQAEKDFARHIPTLRKFFKQGDFDETDRQIACDYVEEHDINSHKLYSLISITRFLKEAINGLPNGCWNEKKHTYEPEQPLRFLSFVRSLAFRPGQKQPIDCVRYETINGVWSPKRWTATVTLTNTIISACGTLTFRCQERPEYTISVRERDDRLTLDVSYGSITEWERTHNTTSSS